MGIYSEFNNEETYGVDMDALVEAFLIDDLTHNYGEQAIKEFCAEGGVGEALVEAKVLAGSRTMMRLDKATDQKRRMIITAIQMAKAKKDPLYGKLVKYKALMKQTREKIIKKYGNKAEKLAVKAQKQYIKTMRGVNLANSGSGAFLTQDPNR